MRARHDGRPRQLGARWRRVGIGGRRRGRRQVVGRGIGWRGHWHLDGGALHLAERRRPIHWSCDLDAVPNDELVGLVSLPLRVLWGLVAGRVDDGVAVQAISHDDFVGVRIVVMGADVDGLDNRGIDVGGRGIVVLVIQVCCRLPVEIGVQIDGIGGLCSRGIDVFVIVKVCRALATKNGVEIDVHCEGLNDAMIDGMLEDSDVCVKRSEGGNVRVYVQVGLSHCDGSYDLSRL